MTTKKIATNVCRKAFDFTRNAIASNPWLRITLACLLPIGSALRANVSSPDILSAEVIERIDLDNDHYSSGFVIEVTGTTMMNEKAKRWQVLQQKGHPIYLVQFPKRGGGFHLPVMYHQRVKRGKERTDRLAISYEAMEKQVANMDTEHKDSHYYDAKDYLDGAAVHEIRIVLGEDDDEDTPTDTVYGWAADHHDIKLDTPLRLEPAEKDKTAEVFINSDPEGAVVYFGQDRMGRTPLRADLPIDYASRVSDSTPIRLEKEGYEILHAKRTIDPPQALEFNLTRRTEQLSIKTDPSGADVFVNGEKIGQSPVSKDFPVDSPLTVRIEDDARKPVTLRGLTVPHEETVDLELTEAAKQRLSEQRETMKEAREGGLSDALDQDDAQARQRRQDQLSKLSDPDASTMMKGLTGKGQAKGRKDEASQDRPEASQGSMPNLGTAPQPGPDERLGNFVGSNRLGTQDDAQATPPFTMAGAWDSNFGMLYLQQIGPYVIGDYAGKGILLGKATGDDTVEGIFTNANQSGIFRFELSDDRDAFQGSWAWAGEELDDPWNGQRASGPTGEPSEGIIDLEGADYAGFLPKNEGLDAAPQTQDPVNKSGTYTTANGRIELITRNGFLLGDCGDAGTLAGVWNGDAYVGRLAADGKAGWFKLHVDTATLSLQPEAAAWLSQSRPGVAWTQQQSLPEDQWPLEQTSSQRPTLDNMLR